MNMGRSCRSAYCPVRTAVNIRSALWASSSLALVLASSSRSGKIHQKNLSPPGVEHPHDNNDNRLSLRRHVASADLTTSTSGNGDHHHVEGVLPSIESKSAATDATVVAAAAAATTADDFLTFCVDFEEGLPEQLSPSTRDYRVVAVTGCQCSGKSTLLNAMFGTGFPVLEHADESLPKRTTVGAWIDLQLCSPPRKKRKYAKKSSSKQTKPAAATADSRLKAAQERKSRAAKPSASTTTGSLPRPKPDTDAYSPASPVDGSSKAQRNNDAAPTTVGWKPSSTGKTRGSDGCGSSSRPPPPPPTIPPTPFVLIDVEGTQSRGRGADGAEFDSRTTLFAVMASDVIMLNLWAHDVGRADGQAYSVLRSVFEEAVRLYGAQRTSEHVGDVGESPDLTTQPPEDDFTVIGGIFRFPKVLMLVLRDVEEDAQFDTLESAARANMEALWRGVEKPDSLRDASLSEVFDLKTAGLPHFKYQRREFAAKASDLSRSFLDPSHSGFVFEREGHRREDSGMAIAVEGRTGEGGRQQDHAAAQATAASRPASAIAAVPLSLVRRRLEGIWASARTNTRLSEAPRRSERAGAVAAGALAESCLSEARPKCARLLDDVEAAAGEAMPLLQFGSDAQGIVDGAVRSFQARVSKSQPSITAPASVVQEKREWLVSAVARELEPAFRAHARQLRAHFHDQFEEAFACVLGGSPDFDASAKRMSKTARKGFLEAMKLAVPNVPGVVDVLRFHWEAELVKLNSDIENRVQDRLSEGTWMLPPDPAELEAAAAKNKMPWWKGLVLRAAAMYLNYLQATQHMRRAKKASEKREKAVPRLPLF